MNNSFRNLIGAAATVALLLGCAAASWHREGIKQVEAGNYEVGVADLAQAVARSPDDMEYRLDFAARREASIQKLIAIADTQRRNGQLDEATATYRRVLSIQVGNQRALRGIEGVEADRRHAGMVADAAKDFERKDFDAAEALLRAVLNEDAASAPRVTSRQRSTLPADPSQWRRASNPTITAKSRCNSATRKPRWCSKCWRGRPASISFSTRI